jgi:hypothetical protein
MPGGARGARGQVDARSTYRAEVRKGYLPWISRVFDCRLRPDSAGRDRSFENYRHSLKETAADIPGQTCIARDNAQVGLDGVLYMKNPERGADPREAVRLRSSAYRAENCHAVTVRYGCPGFTSVVGKPALFGESGKCWVSRHNPPRCGTGLFPRPLIVPSRKLPV